MANQKKDPKVPFSFRTGEKERLEQYAKAEDRTVSSVVNAAVNEFLEARTSKEYTVSSHEPTGYVCPLCQIVRGEPTAKGPSEEAVILRTRHLTVFIAGKWWRTNPGHVIIVPNEHIENIYELPDHIGHAIADMAKKVAVALKSEYSCDGVSTLQHNEPAGSQEVWHYHFHVVPRYTGDEFYHNFENTYWPPIDDRERVARKLQEFLQNH